VEAEEHVLRQNKAPPKGEPVKKRITVELRLDKPVLRFYESLAAYAGVTTEQAILVMLALAAHREASLVSPEVKPQGEKRHEPSTARAQDKTAE
jgi:hypothetical protein